MEDKDKKDHWFWVDYLNFSDQELRPRTENDIPKVIVELGLELE